MSSHVNSRDSCFLGSILAPFSEDLGIQTAKIQGHPAKERPRDSLVDFNVSCRAFSAWPTSSRSFPQVRSGW